MTADIVAVADVTVSKYYDMIDPDKISVPAWAPLDQLHPCDLQSSMLKGDDHDSHLAQLKHCDVIM